MTMQRASLDLSIMPLVVRLSIRLTGEPVEYCPTESGDIVNSSGQLSELSMLWERCFYILIRVNTDLYLS